MAQNFTMMTASFINNSRAYVIAFCLLVFAETADAVPMAFTSEADWLTALGGGAVIQMEDFEASPLGVYAPGPTDVGLFSVRTDTNDPTATDNDNAIVDLGFVNGSRELQAFIIQDGVGGGEADTTFVDFIFETPLTGFAGDFFSAITGDLLVVSVNGASFEFDDFLGGIGNGFFGVVDLMAPIASIQFTVENLSDFGEFWAVDDVRLASVAEPATLALLALGLVGLWFSGHKIQA
jgi:hypothetical protein